MSFRTAQKACVMLFGQSIGLLKTYQSLELPNLAAGYANIASPRKSFGTRSAIASFSKTFSPARPRGKALSPQAFPGSFLGWKL